MINLGTLKEITDLRSVWSHEALNFTPWVAENVDLLADAVGLDITVVETESSVGDFNVDIYASETGTDRKIIIENQLEDTDHDHLGKLITYASGKDADVVIWVVKHAREEHKAAVEWLNNHTDDKIGFFLCEIKLFQIGDSDIAPSFTVVERPNDWTKEIKKTTLTNPTQQQRLEYWNAFNDYAFQNTEFAKSFNKRKPNTDHWIVFIFLEFLGAVKYYVSCCNDSIVICVVKMKMSSSGCYIDDLKVKSSFGTISWKLWV